MRFLVRVTLSGQHRSAAGLRHALQAVGVSEQNLAGAAPGAAAVFTDIAKRLRAPARSVDFVELTAGKITDLPAVRRPERSKSAVSPRQWLSRQGIKRTNPKQTLIVGSGGNKNKPRSVR